MDYSRAKFGDCNFSRFGFIVRKNTDRQTNRHTELHTDTANRYSHDYRTYYEVGSVCTEGGAVCADTAAWRNRCEYEQVLCLPMDV